MAAEVPLVIESQKLSKKLRQNKLKALILWCSKRFAQYRGGSEDNPNFGFQWLILKVK